MNKRPVQLAFDSVGAEAGRDHSESSVERRRGQELSALRLRFPRDGGGDGERVVWDALLSALAAERSAFELVASEGEVKMLVTCSLARSEEVAGLLRAAIPELDVAREDPPAVITGPFLGWRLEPRLGDAFPLAPPAPKEFDFPSALTNLLAIDEDIQATFQLVVEPLRDANWRTGAIRQGRLLTEVEPSFKQHLVAFALGPPAAPAASALPRSIRALQQGTYDKAMAQTLLEVSARFVVCASSREQARRLLNQALELVVKTFDGGQNSLQPARLASPRQFADECERRRPTSPMTMTPAELAALWHRPSSAIATAAGLWRSGKVVRSPRDARRGDVGLGHDADNHPVKLRSDDWNAILLLGASGSGKTTLGISMALDRIRRGEAVVWICPKGGSVGELLARLPASAADRLVPLIPTLEPVIGFNPLHRKPGVPVRMIVEGFVHSVDQLADGIRGPRLDRTLRMATTAVCEGIPGASPVDLYTFLTQAPVRARALSRVSDEFTLQFWRDEFDSLSPAVRSQWVEPVLNRLGPFLGDPLVRRVIGVRQGLDFSQLATKRIALLADFSHGKIGQRHSVVLANLLLSSIQAAAMASADEPEETRPTLNLFVDEAHLVHADLSTMLSVLRAFKVNIVLISQFLHQLEPDVIDAVLANAGIIAFRLSERDAHLLAERFGPEFRPSDLMQSDNYQAAARVIVDGRVLRPFTLFTEPLAPSQGSAWANRMRDEALQRHAGRASSVVNGTLPASDSEVIEVEWESVRCAR